MSDDLTQGAALALMLISMPLISIGTWNDVPPLWWAGLVVLVIGAAIPPLSRFAGSDDADD